MTALEITITLPDSIAQEAQVRGLLAPEMLEQLIRAELERQQRVDRLFETMDKLAALDIPPLTNEELNEEIRAARAERQAKDARSA